MTLADLSVLSVGPTLGAAVGAYLAQRRSDGQVRELIGEFTAPLHRTLIVVQGRVDALWRAVARQGGRP